MEMSAPRNGGRAQLYSRVILARWLVTPPRRAVFEGRADASFELFLGFASETPSAIEPGIKRTNGARQPASQSLSGSHTSVFFISRCNNEFYRDSKIYVCSESRAAQIPLIAQRGWRIRLVVEPPRSSGEPAPNEVPGTRLVNIADGSFLVSLAIHQKREKAHCSLGWFTSLHCSHSEYQHLSVV